MDKNFVAVDFETATRSEMACQLGIVVVKNGEISERQEYLIQPPNNYYDSYVMRFHHVRPEQTMSAPTFDQLWPTIQHYFTTYPLFAHNCNFDARVLYRSEERRVGKEC